MDPALLTLFNQLLTTLKVLAEKLDTGIPKSIDSENPLILKNPVRAVEAKKAETWGTTLQIGKFFPDKVNTGFLKPLFRGLVSLFDDIFINKLPQELGEVLENTLGNQFSGSINIPGGGIISKFSGLTLTDVGDNILKLSKALALSAVGFIAFNFVEWESVLKGGTALILFTGVIAGLSLIKTQLVVGAGTLLLISASLITAAIGFLMMKNVDWESVTAAVISIGALVGIVAIMGAGAALLITGIGVMVLLSGAVYLLMQALQPLFAVNLSVLPEIGANIGLFLTNLNENVTVSTLGFLPLLALSILGIGAALVEFGKFIPILVTLPTSGLANFGSIFGTFLSSLTSSISLGTINRTRELIPLLKDISPVLLKLSESVQRFGQIETSVLPAKAKDIGLFFSNLDINTGWFGDADQKLTALERFSTIIGNIKSPNQSFSEFINAFSSLGDVKINVDILSSETKKTNELLHTSVSIQTQQLNELKQQTSLLNRLQQPSPTSGLNQPQPLPSGTTSVPGVRQQYNSSSYFIKSR